MLIAYTFTKNYNHRRGASPLSLSLCVSIGPGTQMLFPFSPSNESESASILHRSYVCMRLPTHQQDSYRGLLVIGSGIIVIIISKKYSSSKSNLYLHCFNPVSSFDKHQTNAKLHVKKIFDTSM